MTRPRGITIIAALTLLLGVLNLPVGIGVLAGKIRPEDVMGQMPDVGDLKESFAQILGWISILFSLLCIVVGGALLWLKDWARKTVRVIAVLGLLSALVQMVGAFAGKDALRFLGYAIAGGLYFAAFWYLAQAHVRAAFNPAAGAPPGGPVLPPGEPPA
jgi:hypothetical protein